MLKVMMASPTTLTKKKSKRKRQRVDIDMGTGGDSAVFDTNATITIAAAAAAHLQEDGRIKSSRNFTTTTGGFELPVTREERKRRMDRKERFSNGVETKNKQSRDDFDPLYRPLTSSRGGASKKQKTNTSTAPGASSSLDDSHMVGENQNLEKSYFRLTTFPKKEDIRPLDVLIKSLAHIKTRFIQLEDFDWANEQLKSVRQDITVQGIRNRFVLDVYESHARILLEHGDLNEFNQCQTMIRSLTEAGSSASGGSSEGSGDEATKLDAVDKNEEMVIEKCGSRGKATPPPLLSQSPEAKDEFRGYALLYALVHKTSLARELTRCAPETKRPHPLPGACTNKSNNKKQDKANDPTSSKRKKSKKSAPVDVVYLSTKNTSPDAPSKASRSSIIASDCHHATTTKQHIKHETTSTTPIVSSPTLSDDEFESSYTHALNVIKAVSENYGDYRTFFRLYESAPHMSAFLMDFLVKRVRDQAFARIIAAYRPNVSVEHFRELLCFSDLAEARDFLQDSGAVFLFENCALKFWVDCKATRKELCSSDSLSS